MIFSYPEIGTLFNTETEGINTLIVENPVFFCQLLGDIHAQINGMRGNAVLSENNQLLDFAKYAEILNGFIPFEINRKSLLSKITSALEKNALSPEHYEKTMQTISHMENYLLDISFDFPCDIVFPKMSVSSLIKSAAPELRDEYDSLAEKILDYMELVTEFDRNKLFITVNLRSFLPDEQVELFAKTAISHGFNLLMLESFPKKPFSIEKRVIIDCDLCEIGCDSYDSML